MKKKILLRSLIGAPIGVAISYLITVIISLCIGDSRYHPVEPQLALALGSEINAVVIQLLGSVLYGAAFAGASVIWEVEGWSLLRMTATHLTVISVASLPIAYFMRWMPRTPIGVIIYFTIFLIIYAVIWLSQYSVIKKRLRKMNRKLGEMKNN